MRASALAWIRSCLALALVAASLPALAADPVVVGSKRFTESYILGEIVTDVLQQAGVPAVHKQGLGNTAVMEQALASGGIDLYPEYTGTIVRELLKRDGVQQPTLDQLNAMLAPRHLKVAVPLGFNNSYALAMREDEAQRLGIATISDLARTREPLRFGLSHEFLVRADGWPALKRAYAIPFTPASGLDHGLAYQALAQKQVDVVDAYTTDAQIARLHLRVLRDDRNFFPRYDAVLLMRDSVDPRPLQVLAGRIDEATMQAMNAAVEIDGRTFQAVAHDFVAGGEAARAVRPAGASSTRPGFLDRLFAPDLPRLLRQHLTLVFASLALAVVVGIPLGILAHRQPRLSGVLMGVVGAVQTIPSLALLAFLIAIVGRIGFVPALLALAVYALLPIVRNTHTGLATLPPVMRQSALALGMRSGQVLRSIELPLAAPTIFAGIKTAAVLNVGVATVATFIGAGGLGERIVAGLAVNDTAFMLAGAVPAAVLALLTQWVFDGLERWVARRPGRSE